MATDVASKGLDFPAIQHVINYDMPEEIENYGVTKGQRRRGEPRGRPWAQGSRPELCLSLHSTPDRPHWALRKYRHRHHLHQQSLR